MRSGVRSLRAAQDQVVILGTLKSFAKSADRLHEAAAKNAEMRKCVLREHQRGIPRRFEIGAKALAVAPDLVLVGKEQIDIRMPRNLATDPKQRVLAQQVVGIQQGYVFAVGQRQRGIRVHADMAVFAAKRHANARVFCCEPLQQRPDAGQRRRVIGDAQFPMWINLMTYRTRSPGRAISARYCSLA